MHCPSCGFDNPEGLKFCNECGAPLLVRCAQCGFVNQPQAKFCGECGAALSPRAPASTTPPLAPRLHTPLSYTPDYLAEKILHSKAALEGERKQVTVLFADLKGSMELLADRDPEDARQLLDPVLERMMATVHRYEGTVNQVMGDGIMALFGAPIAHEDHAVRACYAALAMQEAIRSYSEEVRRSHGIEVHIRVGLNSGAVVVRAIDSSLHMDYTAVGQTTHLAARMEQLATPGSIRLTAETLRLVEGLVQVTALGPVPVKGLAVPVEVFELVGATALRRRIQAAASRGLSPFVGRQPEMEALQQALARAGAGQGQVVALLGEPGVGKSRLVYEFLHSHHTQGWLILESSSVSYGKATAYLPVCDLLKAYCHIEDCDDLRTVRAKVTGQILTLDENLQDTLPAVLALFEALPADSPFLHLDPLQRRRRTLEALKRMLLRESQVKPLLLVFEDLHWIDSETQAVLDLLVDSLPTARMLVLVNYRPEYQHDWGSKTYYTQLRLDPLPHASADELLQALLGDDVGARRAVPLQDLKQLLITRTEGNPFFLEESVRTLVETGVLVGEPGAYRLAKPLDSLQVPATVQAVLAARIDRLPPEEKRLLQTAAVIGTEVSCPLLQAIAELSENALRSGLAHLQAAEFLYETSLFPEHAYTFKHALTHEVAYGGLLRERQRLLHGRIVAAMETLYADRLADQVERLAHHALRGEVWDKAVTYLHQAGAKASERSALREAVAYYEQALGALERLPQSRHMVKEAVDLRLDLRYPLLMLGELSLCVQYLGEAETLAQRLDDRRRLGWVAAYMTQYCWLMGDHARAIEAGERALTVAAECGDVALQVRAHLALGRVYHALGDYPRALSLLRWALAWCEREQGADLDATGDLTAANIGPWLACCAAELGGFAEGREAAEAGLRVAEVLEEPASLIEALYGLGLVHLLHGDVEKAIPVLARGWALAQEGSLRIWFAAIGSALGYAYGLSGRMGEALPLLESAVKSDEALGITTGQPLFITWLSEGYVRVHRLQESGALAGHALELSRACQERGNEAYALRLLGDIAAHGDPLGVEQAEAHYQQALALAEELGMRPLQAHCHLGLGTLYAMTGQHEQARTDLSAAIALYRAMDMTFWLPQTEAALAQVEEH
jgi:class 3 adenylate cyclase/tetratricopeptide (TPR) repeat protein